MSKTHIQSVKVAFVKAYMEAQKRATVCGTGLAFQIEDRERLLAMLPANPSTHLISTLCGAIASIELRGTVPSSKQLYLTKNRHYQRICFWRGQQQLGRFNMARPATGQHIGMIRTPVQKQFDDFAKTLINMGVNNVKDAIVHIERGFKHAQLDKKVEPVAQSLITEFKQKGFTREEVERVMELVEDAV